jgi:hypothetical protein
MKRVALTLDPAQSLIVVRREGTSITGKFSAKVGPRDAGLAPCRT